MRMKHFWASLAAVSSSLVIGGVQAADWDMPTPYGDSNFHTVNIRQFAEDVKTATDGELNITVHSGGSLIKHHEIKNSVRRGLVPIGELIMSRLANEDPLFEVDSVPYLASNYDEAWELWQASKDILAKRLESQRLKLLFAVPWPPQGIYTKFPVETGEELQGVKMRAYNKSSERLAELLGAIPTQVEVPDIPTAFGTGRVDAMITSPSTGANTRAWDYLSNFNHAQLWLPKNMVVVNAREYSRLPEEVQAAIEKAAADAEKRGWEASKEETDAKIAIMRENGIEISEPSEALSKRLEKVGKTMTDEWLERAGPDGQKLIDAYREQ
ncbi:TRAP transporter substrate-binding protein DctP [Marinobacter nanhaiticus D15-8W]|uniref:C4-dicarboxylate ABC transporter substrate-binding protein n=1 Tax=Marinobacter nanhaiticus D15-8W TaxID=626887 RepID=N6WVN8_9GAMM|nr:TRAP transporter substrate-binding protein [Marinobacter nanhaiticus]ENO12913.2 C4-dicarboxylate ABC transporter substrate-binding protein [Marinobacter nanhaiticus D15-8W]BES70264.1 TRAP transporter substrate-binding protein DctP [Marinobacter nanhaiticus D15-8W]